MHKVGNKLRTSTFVSRRFSLVLDKISLMHRLNPKYVRITGIVLACLLVILIVGGYILYTKREALLQQEITKAKAKAKKDYNLDLKIGAAHFVGFSTIAFTDITIVPEHRDSLLNIKQFEVSIKVFPLLFGNIKLADIILHNGYLNLTDINHVKNFDFLFKHKKDSTDNHKLDLSELANNLVKQVLYKIPDDLTLNNFLVSFKNDSTNFKLLTKTASIKNGALTSTINVVDSASSTWHIAGRMIPSDKDIDIKLYADGKKVELPFIEKRFHLKVNFDTLSTRLRKVEHESGQTRIYGSWGVKNLLVHQARLSSSDILVPNGAIDANLFVGANYISIDSSSAIHLKKITAHPYIKYTLNPVKIYEMKLNTGWMDAQDLFDSFPSGIFNSLDGMQVAGKLNYSLNFFLNTADPNNVQFDSKLSKGDFRIIRYGKTDLNRLNGPFVYTPYEKGKPMTPRSIGSSNPYYTPLDQIAPDLRNAVMTAEDPTFYRNNGFVEEAIRKSLATDYKDKKFKRGGSTISMQLVKNAFLSREKTIARKIEETFIVWLIVNNQLMTKNRILEVYFNIIEWGNDVYGIGEASRYYFGKTPAELTLGESIYLASIVPHPKTGLYAFMPDGTLRPTLENYFNTIGNFMVGHGQAQHDSLSYGFYSVRLKENLRKKIKVVDTATADKMLKENDDDAVPVVAIPEQTSKPSFFQRLFGKKDTTTKKDGTLDPKARLKMQIQKLRDDEEKQELAIDTSGKTRKQIRQEKRAMRADEKNREKILRDKN